MNLFTLSWVDFDEYEYITFSHPTKTKVEFIEDVENIRLNKMEQYINDTKDTSFVDGWGWTSFATNELIKMGYTEFVISGIEHNSDSWLKELNSSIIDKIQIHNDRVHQILCDEIDEKLNN